MASDPSIVTKLFEKLPLQAMQSVANGYMAWYVTRVTQSLDETIAGRRAELRDNDAKEASYRPSPAELSAIERMQRSGVTGVDLLDRMVEQGEDWLVLTMRRLDHFEKTGLAPKDYSTWCEHALGGAYDWIDHERLGASGATSGAPSGGASGGAGVPDWLASRGGSSGRSPDEGPTAPVPSVGGPRWSDNGGAPAGAGYYGGQPQPGQSQPGQDDDGKGRNIFRIFSN
ncbi:MAG TPA: hypothetical protein VFQ25_03725 [Ktedonobacterales bacterium]|nr:hypothetical protein [Ktedonobacterales bacterium]